MNENMQKLLFLFTQYLDKNTERFNFKEKVKFRNDFARWLTNPSSETITDEVFDFLVSQKIVKGEVSREDEFVGYLNSKYSSIKFSKILDVGAGRLCKVSAILAKYGAEMYAIDPKIRLTEQEAQNLGIKQIFKNKFQCDRFASENKGTDISMYDRIIGLEPCDAAEHIIRQCLKYDKPFDILLCGSPHESLIGQNFFTYHDLYKYLSKISAEVEIKKVGGSYYASNDNESQNGLGL